MNELLLERIDSYLDGSMSGQERSMFEAELKENKELSSLFQVYSEIETGMRTANQYSGRETALRQTLEKLGQRHILTPQHDMNNRAASVLPGPAPEGAGKPEPEQGRVLSISIWRTLLVVAACTGAVIIGVTWYRNHAGGATAADAHPMANNTPRKSDGAAAGIRTDTAAIHEKTALSGNPATHHAGDSPAAPAGNTHQVAHTALFAANFAPDAAPEDIPEDLVIGFDHYTHREYDECAAAFGKAGGDTRGEGSDKKLSRFYRHYYRAQSYLAASQAQKAIPALKAALTQRPDSYWEAKTNWYLGLAYVKTGDVPQAVIAFNKAAHSQQGGIYSHKRKR